MRRKASLGMWWRLGIVLTAFWMVGGTTFFAVREINQWDASVSAGYSLCLRFNEAVSRERQADCLEEMSQSRKNFSRAPVWQGSALGAGILAVLVWLIVGILYGSVRWVLAGRKPVEKPE